MTSNDTFAQNIGNKQKLNTQNSNLIASRGELNLSIRDIKNLAFMKYGGVNSFGRALGVTKGMASILLSGVYVPLKPETIHKIADCLGIDPVVLSQIYADCKNKQMEKAKNG